MDPTCRPDCVAEHHTGDPRCSFIPHAVPLLHPVPGHDTHVLIAGYRDGRGPFVELDIDGNGARVLIGDLEDALASVRQQVHS